MAEGDTIVYIYDFGTTGGTHCPGEDPSVRERHEARLPCW
jgi:hypothetical protein